jgi:hypothetical protein
MMLAELVTGTAMFLETEVLLKSWINTGVLDNK